MSISSLSSNVLSYSSVSTSGSTNFSGLGNGTDFDEIREATITAESYKKQEYEESLTYSKNAVDVLTTLDEELVTLSGTLQKMDEVSEFYSYTGNISGDEVSAVAEDGAKPCSHNLVVGQLAKTDRWVAEDYDIASKDTEICSADSSITLSYAGEDITLNIPSGTTAEEFVDLINNSSEFTDKIEASLIYDGSNYHLSLTGNDTGSDNVLGLTDLSALDSISASDFTNTQTAQNAKLKIDGYPSETDSWLERSSNTVDDLIDNVTLTLSSTTDSDGVEIAISYDTDSMVEKVASFVSEVNQIIYDLQSVTGRLDTSDDDEDSDTFTLKGGSLDLIYNRFKSILSSLGEGFTRYDSGTETGDLYSSLSMIGISTDSTEGSSSFGQLVLDYDELEEALSKSPESVARLFAASGESTSDSSSISILSSISGLTSAGEYDVEYEVSGGQITSATINGVAMKLDGNTMLAQRNSDANGLYLKGTETTDGIYSATVLVKQGKIGEIADYCSKITDVSTGSVPLLISSYEDSCTKLENEIYDEAARLDSLDSYLTTKYAKLDALLQKYSNLSTQLTTTLDTSSSD
ncbi:flagellar filament capping protein FliD [Desulfovibrio gilichinskyi]|uniref:Flagellar hook-associated protein 2 n=1 Tax=Desulfovibrio gilichinskyi TaxID=1519643 RepID=A0A1X7CEK9_9BACT|nr:flagellar filament capping protein FliD [Desulfovibrio gilichinskyi]SME95355.1 flagellar hook-associated protein 2 [Desulfovibrio gilichinskyi]